MPVLEAGAHLTAFLSAFLIGSLAVLTYYRQDDLEWLTLAATFAEVPWITFVDSSVQVAGYYRPVIVVVWILGYWAWGLDPTGYALLLAATFGVANVLLYRLGALLHGRRAGLLAALLFVAFVPTMNSMWWRSLLTSGVELVFLLGSLYLLAHGLLRGSPRAVAAGALVAGVGFFAKETVALVPLLLLPFLLVYRGRIAVRGWWPWALPPMLAAGAYLVMFWLPAQLPAAYPFSRLGTSLEAASALGRPLPVMLGNAASQAGAFLHIYAVFLGPLSLAVLFLLGATALARPRALWEALPWRPLSFAFLWALLGILPGLLMLFPGGWYMLESALGASLFLALLAIPSIRVARSALHDLLDVLRQRGQGWWRTRDWLPLVTIPLAAVLLLGFGGVAVVVGSGNLAFLRDNTANFREGAAFLATEAEPGSQILVAVPSTTVHIPRVLERELAFRGREDVTVGALGATALQAAMGGTRPVYVVVPVHLGSVEVGDEVQDVLDETFHRVAQYTRPHGSLTVWRYVPP